MKYLVSITLALLWMVAPAGPSAIITDVNASVPGYSGIPTFSIVSVVTDSTVTIITYNFPANDSFDVLMGYMGTRGVNGTKVDTGASGSGGSFTATYNIPAALHGQYQIAIRLQSNTGSGYYAYNWFYNNTSGGGTGGPTQPGTGYTGIPTFSIVSVVVDNTVTIQTSNFPANYTFDVLIGYMGTRGVNGVKVDTVASGSGGSFTATYTLPAALHGQYQIAIRLQSPSSGYYAYNWFYNNTSGGTGGPVKPGNGYTGIPTFSIVSVVRNKSVTITTYNFPANDTFNLLMGYMGTRGVNGINVDTVASGSGGSFTATYNIPAALSGQYQIAIRLYSPSSGYYAYNWFYNSIAP